MGLLVGGLLAAAPSGAARAQQAAQPSMALDRYRQPLAGDAFFATPAPWVGGHLIPRAMVTFDYANEPLVLVDANGEQVAALVTAQGMLHLGASLPLWDRLMVGVDIPFGLLQSGEATSVTGGLLAAPEGATVGDLRVSLRGRLWGEYDQPFQLGLGAHLMLPTGTPDSYASEAAVYGKPELLAGGRAGLLVWSASIGSVLRGSDNPHSFDFAAAAGLSLAGERLLVGPELRGGIDLSDAPLSAGGGQPIERNSTVDAEWLGGAQVRIVEGLTAGAAAGSGLAKAVGTPVFRVLGRIAWAPLPAQPPAPGPPAADRDGDGIFDASDACPEQPGLPHDDLDLNGCPDSDGDGIFDPRDACPKVAGVASVDPAEHGCPAGSDRDGDGIADASDACPEQPGPRREERTTSGCPDSDGDGIIDLLDACPKTKGVANAEREKNGCPPDGDGDGIIDPLDACPTQAGPKSADPERNGCPRVIVTGKQILILQKIAFAFDAATILPESAPLLDDVAATLKQHPEISLLEVQGHTDDKGGKLYNLALSSRRAKAVRQALVARGVEAQRLRAKGYGLAKPLVPNDSEAHRAENRRVEFEIVERKKP